MTRSEPNEGVYAVAEERVSANGACPSSTAALLSLPVSVAVSVGRIRTTIEQLLDAAPETILTLDARLDDPVELIVGDQVIARGRLVDIAEGAGVGVEIIEIIEASGVK